MDLGESSQLRPRRCLTLADRRRHQRRRRRSSDTTPTRHSRQVSNFLGQDGVAIIPSAASVAPLLTATGAEVDQIRMRTFRITCVAGLVGLPQVSLPFATDAGLPIGVSLLGPAGSDLALIRLATALWKRLQT